MVRFISTIAELIAKNSATISLLLESMILIEIVFCADYFGPQDSETLAPQKSISLVQVVGTRVVRNHFLEHL